MVISCANCNEEGHRSRDCPQERKKDRGPRTCKNCGSEEHIAKECDQPPNPENVECRNCGESKSNRSKVTAWGGLLTPLLPSWAFLEGLPDARA